MTNQTSKILIAAVLLVVGYFVGLTQWPETAYAQEGQAVDKPSQDFVVVAGHAATSANAPHFYYVVTGDGRARKVSIDGAPLYAPKTEYPSKLQLKHELPSRIRMDHSGRVSR